MRNLPIFVDEFKEDFASYGIDGRIVEISIGYNSRAKIWYMSLSNGDDEETGIPLSEDMVFTIPWLGVLFTLPTGEKSEIPGVGYKIFYESNI